MNANIEKIGLFVMLAAIMCGEGVMAKSMDRVKVPKNFNYSMTRTVNVSVDVVGPAGRGFSGLSFYSQPKSSRLIRLLESGVSNADGRYVGPIIVPSYIKNLIVGARLQDYRGQKKLSIKHDSLVGTIRVK